MQTPFLNFPVTSIFIVSGTRNQFVPAMYEAAISELPTPVAKEPTAPRRFMWLSVPRTTSPGFIIPASSITCWPIPWLMSKRRVTPCFLQNSRIIFWFVATFSECAGA